MIRCKWYSFPIQIRVMSENKCPCNPCLCTCSHNAIPASTTETEEPPPPPRTTSLPPFILLLPRPHKLHKPTHEIFLNFTSKIKNSQEAIPLPPRGSKTQLQFPSSRPTFSLLQNNPSLSFWETHCEQQQEAAANNNKIDNYPHARNSNP